MTQGEQGVLSGSTKRLLVVTAAVIVIGAFFVIYGLISARQNAADAKRRACIQSHVVSAGVALDDAAIKRISQACET